MERANRTSVDAAAESHAEPGGDTASRPQPRWHLLYFILAAFDIATISGSLALNHALIQSFERSVETNRLWADRSGSYAELAALATNVNMPGNEVFDSGDVLGEQAERDLAHTSFGHAISQARTELEAIDNQQEAIPLLEQLDEIVIAMDNMVRVQDEIFKHFQHDEPDLAGAKMATMDRENANVGVAIGTMGTLVRKIQQTEFDTQAATTRTVRRIEYLLATMILVMVLVVGCYGHNIAKQVKRTNEEIERSAIVASQEADRANAANREIQALRVALDQHSIMSVADGRGRIIDANSAFCRISGYTREELIGNDHRLLNGGHHPKSFWVDAWKQITAGDAWRGEVCNRAKDGSVYWVDSTIVPYLDEHGKPEKYISIRFDITNKKRVEIELEEAKAQAERANAAKSEFLANMSHEIRTPMTAILGYADLLAGDLADDPEAALEAANTIQSNAGHLLSVINDILDVSKIEAGQLTIEQIGTNPIALLEQVVSVISPRAHGKGLSLACHYSTELPNQIQTDPTRLRQILLNIIGNAVKFTDHGSIHIDASCDRTTNTMRFVISDTGIGMDEEQLASVSRFDAFTQADSSMARRYGGSGLGLRISNSLAEALGGGISVRSTRGAGSSFTVTIGTGELAGIPDAKIEAPAAPEPMTIAGDTKDSSLPLAGRHILLAEDGPDNQRLISFYLRKAGASVTIADNGRAAIELYNRPDISPDVILMDMQMPEMDGYAASRALREAGCQTPIIAITAHAMDGDRQRCLDAGCDEYTTKPIDRDRLIELCAARTAGSATRRAA